MCGKKSKREEKRWAVVDRSLPLNRMDCLEDWIEFSFS